MPVLPYQVASTGVNINLQDPDMYDVILLNDDFTTMEMVVAILCSVFYHSEAEAQRIMLDVHNNGSGVAGTYTLDIAESKKRKATNIARADGYPLRLKIMPHK